MKQFLHKYITLFFVFLLFFAALSFVYAEDIYSSDSSQNYEHQASESINRSNQIANNTISNKKEKQNNNSKLPNEPFKDKNSNDVQQPKIGVPPTKDKHNIDNDKKDNDISVGVPVGDGVREESSKLIIGLPPEEGGVNKDKDLQDVQQPSIGIPPSKDKDDIGSSTKDGTQKDSKEENKDEDNKDASDSLTQIKKNNNNTGEDTDSKKDEASDNLQSDKINSVDSEADAANVDDEDGNADTGDEKNNTLSFSNMISAVLSAFDNFKKEHQKPQKEQVNTADNSAKSSIASSFQNGYEPHKLLVKFKKSFIVEMNSSDANSKITQFATKYNLQKLSIIPAGNLVVFKTQDEDPGALISTIKNSEKEKVEYAEPNYVYELSAIQTNDPEIDKLWGLHNTGQVVNFHTGTKDADIDYPEAMTVYENNTASDNEIIVAVVDTGVMYDHPDLADVMWNGSDCVGQDSNGDPINGGCIHGFNFHTNSKDPYPVSFRSYHGTHVAGTIAAKHNNSIGILGVAPDVKIMAINIDFGSGHYLDVDAAVKGIYFAADNGAKVINASWGGGGYSQALYDAIKYFGEHGGLFVAAAGNAENNNDNRPAYPASYDLDNIIAVAATDNKDQLASFSNYGKTTVDVGAPGVDIYSTYFTKDSNRVAFESFDSVTPPELPAGFSTSTGSDWGTAMATTSSVALFSDVNHQPYAPNASSTITSPIYDLSAYKEADMVFYVGCDTEYPDSGYSDDRLELWVSKDGGQNFSLVQKIDELAIDYHNWDPPDSSGVAFGYFLINLGQEYTTDQFQYKFKWITDDDGDTGSDGIGCFVDNIRIDGYIMRPDYTFLQGTSMATPHVAGLAGMLLSFKPSLIYSSVKNAIISSVDKISSLTGKVLSDGRINAFSALKELMTGRDLMSPTITLQGDNPLFIPIGGSFTDPGATAVDDIDGDVSDKIMIDLGGLNTLVPIKYTITYSVTDSAGNNAIAKRDVIVGHKELTLHTKQNILGNKRIPQVKLSDGNVMVFYNSANGMNERGIVAQVVSATSTIQDSFEVFTLVGDYQMNSFDAVRLVNGNIFVVWEEYNNETQKSYIKGKIINESGGLVKDVFTINSLSAVGNQRPKAITLTNGDVFVVWDSQYAEKISGVILDANGNLKKGEYILSHNGGLRPVPTVLSDGKTAIVLGQGSAAPSVIIMDENASTTITEFAIQAPASSAGKLQQFPVIVPLTDGGFFVAWEVWNSISGSDVYGIRYDNNYLVAKPAFRLNKEESTVLNNRIVADNLNNTDQLIISWFHTGGRMISKIITPDGIVLLQETPISYSNEGTIVAAHLLHYDTNQVSFAFTDQVGVAQTSFYAKRLDLSYYLQHDSVPPSISLIGNQIISMPLNGVFEDPGTTATDNQDGDLTGQIQIDTSQLNTAVPGVYKIHYSVVDSAGNQAQAERMVAVGMGQINDEIESLQTKPFVTSIGNSNRMLAVWESFDTDKFDEVNDDTDGYIAGKIVSPNLVVAGDEFIVNDYKTGRQSKPHAARFANGTALVVWASTDHSFSDQDETHISAKIIDENASSTVSEFQLNTNTQGVQSDPFALPVNDGSQMLVLWTSSDTNSSDGNGTHIAARLVNSDGTFATDEFQVNGLDSAGNQTEPKATMLPDGNILVTWTSEDRAFSDNKGTHITAKIISPTGDLELQEFTINQGFDGNQKTAMPLYIGDGMVMVVWESFDTQKRSGFSDSNGSGRISGALFRVSVDHGISDYIEFQVNDAGEGVQKNPFIVLLPNKNVLALWESFDPQTNFDFGPNEPEQKDSDSSHIAYKVLNKKGKTVIRERQLNDFVDGWQSDPFAIVTNNKNVLALWGSADSAIFSDDDSSHIEGKVILNSILNSSDDYTPPTITLAGESEIQLHIGDTYKELGATAVDDVDGSVSVDIDSSGVHTEKAGVYEVIYSAVDTAGNTARAVRRVLVLTPISNGGGGGFFGGSSIGSIDSALVMNAFIPKVSVADITNDGKIDLFDFNLLISHWNVNDGILGGVDINKDGKINLLDFNLLIANWTE